MIPEKKLNFIYQLAVENLFVTRQTRFKCIYSFVIYFFSEPLIHVTNLCKSILDLKNKY